MSFKKAKIDSFSVKLVIVGDGAVGKTALLLAYMRDEFLEGYEPTVYETTTKDVMLPSFRYPIVLTVEDTAGQEDYEHFRPFAYSCADVILLCFSIDNPDSLNNVPNKWIKELRHYCPAVPIVLVCTKSDLQNIAVPSISEYATEISRQIGVEGYMECSAKRRTNVRQVFETAVTLAVNRKLTLQNEKQKKKCDIL